MKATPCTTLEEARDQLELLMQHAYPKGFGEYKTLKQLWAEEDETNEAIGELDKFIAEMEPYHV